MYLSMSSPRGGCSGICGAFELSSYPYTREFNWESGPQGGDVWFFLRRTETKSRVARDGHLGTGSPWVWISGQSLKVSSFSKNTRTTTCSHFDLWLLKFFKLVFLDGIKRTSFFGHLCPFIHCFILKQWCYPVLRACVAIPRWGDLIWFYHFFRPQCGDFDQKLFWKVKCPTYARTPPPPPPPRAWHW